MIPFHNSFGKHLEKILDLMYTPLFFQMQLRISELRVVFLSEDYLWKNYNISHEKIEVATAAV